MYVQNWLKIKTSLSFFSTLTWLKGEGLQPP